jgi:hypothetical protein
VGHGRKGRRQRVTDRTYETHGTYVTEGALHSLITSHFFQFPAPKAGNSELAVHTIVSERHGYAPSS